jgi:transcription initiation factor TFIIIB Brf1 subunit/transcription initiation factor TFIIB
MAYYKKGCADCHGFSFVTNYKEGDVICTGCGLVQEGCIVMDDAFYNPNSFAQQFPAATQEMTKETNYLSLDKLNVLVAMVSVPEAIGQEAERIFESVRQKYAFRGAPLKAAMLSAIYMACNLQGIEGVSRNAVELCETCELDTQVFSRVLKHVCDLVPHIAAQMTAVKETDVFTRHVQLLEDIPRARRWDVRKETGRQDAIRRSYGLMMGSPPNVVNAVLIYSACAALGIALNRQVFLGVTGISKATLDRYINLFRLKGVV